MRKLFLAAIISISLGCGGSENKPDTAADTTAEAAGTGVATSEAKADSSAAAEADVSGVVTTCKEEGNVCLLPAKYVKKLCSNVNPDVALVYFKKGTPFTRGYLTRNTDAVNASGGASGSSDKLAFDEEVIVLSVRKNTTGIEVSGASGGYDVLRWDGSCASLAGEELTFKAPPKAKQAKLEWKIFSEESQNAMLNDANVAKINKTRRDECKGVTMGDVSKACVKAVDQLSEAIATFIRGGGEVPAPKALK